MWITREYCPVTSKPDYYCIHFFIVFSFSSLQDNTHRLTLSMSPAENYMEKQAEAEDEKLLKKIEALSESDRKEIYEKGKNEPESRAQATHKPV